MAYSKNILCILLACFALSHGSATEDGEKTTEAVVKAVSGAESRGEAQQEEEATAAADATMEVLKSEGDVQKEVPQEVMDNAEDLAKKTFVKLDDAKVGRKAAADASAKVAIAEVDGASGHALKEDVKENAEKAAVAAVEGVADHPDSKSAALSEAIATVVEEETNQGTVDVTEKGVMTEAVETVEELPSMAENAVLETSHAIGMLGAVGIFAAVMVVGAIFTKSYKEHFEVTPYMKSLRLIREEATALPEKDDVEQYREMR